jgi:PLP dependent protein
MNAIQQGLSSVRSRIRQAERLAGRPEGAVTLIAVGKTHPAASLQAAYGLGQRDFGENYVQEAVAKQAEFNPPDVIWHFIGPIQSNKTRLIAGHFHWVHTVDRLKIAERLNEQRPAELPPLNVCLQVNASGEASKSGASFEELGVLAQAVAALPRLRLRGLMAIPAPESDPARQGEAFRAVRHALETLAIADLDTLSMGMSGDLEAAVLEGATLVRVGTAIFGERE